MTELLWFSMGLLTVLVVAGARAWARDLGLRMSWWKWSLAGLWYGWVLFTVAVAMTFVGERETEAALRLFALMAVLALVSGVGLLRLLWRGREQRVG